jgi:hypothetical protein
MVFGSLQCESISVHDGRAATMRRIDEFCILGEVAKSGNYLYGTDNSMFSAVTGARGPICPALGSKNGDLILGSTALFLIRCVPSASPDNALAAGFCCFP